MQVDLLDFFRHERPWGQLYRMVDRLPAWGHYKSQLAMDPEWAKVICDQEDAGERERTSGLEPVPEPVRTPFGYTDIVSRLELIADRIADVQAEVFASYNKDHKRPDRHPIPRPETAVDQERERRVRVELEALDAQFLGEEGLVLRLE